jgi:hypothetical protein
MKPNLYTGYFANLKKYLEDLTPVAIVRDLMPYVHPILQFQALAPSRALLDKSKNGLSKEAFEKEFYMELEKHDPMQILGRLPMNAILLCYEKADGSNPHDWCHRHMVAKWIETKTGILVPEARSSQVKQEKLFE